MSSQLTFNSSEAYSVDDSQSVSASSHITEPLLTYFLWIKKKTHTLFEALNFKKNLRIDEIKTLSEIKIHIIRWYSIDLLLKKV